MKSAVQLALALLGSVLFVRQAAAQVCLPATVAGLCNGEWAPVLALCSYASVSSLFNVKTCQGSHFCLEPPVVQL